MRGSAQGGVAFDGGANRAVPRVARHRGRIADVPSTDHRRPRHELVGSERGPEQPVVKVRRAPRPTRRLGTPTRLLSWETERADRYNRVQWLYGAALPIAVP